MRIRLTGDLFDSVLFGISVEWLQLNRIHVQVTVQSSQPDQK